MTRAINVQATWGGEGLRSPGGTDLCNTASRQGFPTMIGEEYNQGRRLCAAGGLQGRGPLPSRSRSRCSGQRAEEGLEMLPGGLRGLTFRRSLLSCMLGSSGAVYRRDWVALPCNDSVFIVAGLVSRPGKGCLICMELRCRLLASCGLSPCGISSFRNSFFMWPFSPVRLLELL